MQRRLDHVEKPECPAMRTLLNICWFSLMLPAAANAEELGRLFFTPEQRAQMDYNYAREARPDSNARALELNGIVQMHGGKRTAWINGVPQTAGRSVDDYAGDSGSGHRRCAGEFVDFIHGKDCTPRKNCRRAGTGQSRADRLCHHLWRYPQRQSAWLSALPGY